MAYVIDEEMVIDDLFKAQNMLSDQAYNFLLLVTHQRGKINQQQFNILNDMHDEVIKSIKAPDADK